ncbi:MAG: DUF4421 domain-containing protein [Cyclobacteriaceae bacterium]|nr:DUF4421 domain-containing protein [Cyclobacteriaceae bacterium HetDA_MAG_MS6]
MMKRVYVLLLLLACWEGNAQMTPPDSLSKREVRRWEKNHNIIDLSDQFSIKLFLLNKSNEIKHHDGLTKKKITYKPNESVNFGFGINYKWLGFDLAFSLPNANDDNDVFGRTRRFDLQSSLFLHKFVVDVGYQRYKGYYGSNPSLYDPGFDSTGSYPIRPDIITSAFNISSFYIFNHKKFSYRHAFTFNEIQRRSAGSFLAGAYFNTYKMDADSTLVPIALRDEFDPEADFRGVQYVSMGITLGYAYNFIFLKHFYVSATLAIGAGPVFEHIPERDDLPTSRDVDSTPFALARAAFGYNGLKWFAGMSLFGISGGGQEDHESHIERGSNNFRLHLGFRLPPPKGLKNLIK